LYNDRPDTDLDVWYFIAGRDRVSNLGHGVSGMIVEDIQSDEAIPVEYEMTAEELADLHNEYNDWTDQQEQPDDDRPLYIWLR
jgi:hypothetical protein